jgi:phosphate-selective porin OprO/OprP
MNKRFSLILTVSIFCLLALGSMMSFAEDNAKATTKDGILVIESEDGNFRYQLDSRLYIDFATYDEDESIIDLHSGSELRRMRLAFKVVLWKDWLAEFDVDFSENSVGIKDAWVGYQGIENTLIRVGNYRSPFSLEELTSSRYSSFIERGLPNAFAPGRLIGLGFSEWGCFWQVSGGIFNQEAGDIDEETVEDSDESTSFIGRISAAPLNCNNNVIHLGAAYAYRTTDAFSTSFRYRAYDETKISKIRLLNTGKIKNSDYTGLLGLETVIQFGPLHVQGEYMQANVYRLEDSGKPDASFDGGYVFGSFFLTGDHMPYDVTAGEFGRVMPEKEFGAIELLARYSWINLNDEDAEIMGGEGKDLTFGLTWYFNANVKMLINYTIVDHDENATAGGSYEVPEDGFDYNILAVRFLVTI